MPAIKNIKHTGSTCIIRCLQEAEARGEDYDRVKLLDVGADDAEKWERKKKKKNPDPGFSGNCSNEA